MPPTPDLASSEQLVTNYGSAIDALARAPAQHTELQALSDAHDTAHAALVARLRELHQRIAELEVPPEP